MNRKLLLTGVSLLAAASIGLTGSGAAADYTDEEGATHYGWSWCWFRRRLRCNQRYG